MEEIKKIEQYIADLPDEISHEIYQELEARIIEAERDFYAKRIHVYNLLQEKTLIA